MLRSETQVHYGFDNQEDIGNKREVKSSSNHAVLDMLLTPNKSQPEQQIQILGFSFLCWIFFGRAMLIFLVLMFYTQCLLSDEPTNTKNFLFLTNMLNSHRKPRNEGNLKIFRSFWVKFLNIASWFEEDVCFSYMLWRSIDLIIKIIDIPRIFFAGWIKSLRIREIRENLTKINEIKNPLKKFSEKLYFFVI